MDSSELIRKVRRIEIKSRGLSENVFAGAYHTAFKGRGMTFSEVREYQYGDDVRQIDWNVTARYNRPYVKVFEEERELTMMLLVDVSGSRNFGTLTQTKRDMLAEVAATLAFSSIENNDKIGMMLFSDRIEKYIPAGKGRKHVLRLIRELVDFEPVSTRTDIDMALRYFTRAQKKRCTAFLISDFMDEAQFAQAMLIASKKHDVAALQIYDQRDAQLVDVGVQKLLDAETGESLWVDTSDKSVREQYRRRWLRQQAEMNELLTRAGVDSVSIRTDEDYVKALMRLFALRS